MILGAIADDLTGATDLSLTLSREGMRVIQVAGVPSNSLNLDEVDAVVVALKSRTIAAAEAVRLSQEAARFLISNGAQRVFFKYCSTFDSTSEGNIGPVTEALLKLLGESATIACPSFPANGRTVYKGHLFVGDELLSDSSMKDHPLTPMTDPNLVRVLQGQMKSRVALIPLERVRGGTEELRAELAKVTGAAIVDALTEDDLRTIGGAYYEQRLLTGGSGLAIGLPEAYRRAGWLAAEHVASRFTPPPGRCAVLAGSCSAATRRQIEAAKKQGTPTLKLEILDIAEERMSPAVAADFVDGLTNELPPIVYSSDAPENVLAIQQNMGRDYVGELVEQFMGQLACILRDRGFTRLLVAGGETSGAVVAALGVEAMEIGPEIDPGVPWTTSLGDEPKLALALKSGNFGTDDFFLKAWKHLA